MLGGGCVYRGGGEGVPIEPGGVRHAGVTWVNCPGAKLVRVSAVFADGSWAGSWEDLEGPVKITTIYRMVAVRWLATLKALRDEPNPEELVGVLVAQLGEGKKLSFTCPPAGCDHLPEGALRQKLDASSKTVLRHLLRRCYDARLRPDVAHWGEREFKRDIRAEAEFKVRPDARQLAQDALGRGAAADRRIRLGHSVGSQRRANRRG